MLAGWLILPSRAEAACSSNSPTTGETVTCSGTDTSGVTGTSGINNVTVNIDSGAGVSVTGEAITIRGTGWNIDNQGSVTGSGYGVNADSSGGGSATVTNSGTITGTSYFGVYLWQGGTITNTGTIQGGRTAITGYNQALYVYNSGSLIGGTSYGAQLVSGGELYNYAGGVIRSDNTGVMYSGGSAAINVLNNSGTITSTSQSGVYFGIGGTLTNNAGGVITGTTGVRTSAAATTIVNDGSITGTAGYGINIANGGTITNNGTISGTTYSIFHNNAAFLSIVNNGTLTGDVWLAGNDSVTLKAGSTLTGNISASGVNNTLTLGAGSSATGTLTSNVSNVKTVTVNAPSTRWVIDNGYTVSSNTEVQAGTLSVNGSIDGTVLVDSAGTLGGNGTVGPTTVNGALAPGNSIGTITVNGDLTFGSGSTYQVEVSPSAADRTNVTGTATLAGTMQALPTGGTYTVGKTYTVLSATGGRNGTFSAFDVAGSFGAGIDPEVLYTGSDVLIYLAPGAISPFLPANASQNGAAVAGAVDTALAAGQGRSTFLPLFSLSQQQLSPGLAALSGEVAGAAPAAAFSAMGDTLSQTAAWSQQGEAGRPGCPKAATIWGRQRADTSGCADDDAWTLRGSIVGNSRSVAADDTVGSHQLDQQTYGMTAGLEKRVSADARIGAMLTGYGSHSSVSDGLGSDDSNGVVFGLYGSQWLNAFYVSGALAGLWQQGSTDRQLTALGVSGALNGDHSSYGIGGRIEAGARLPVGGMAVMPFVAGQFASLYTPSYTESGDRAVSGYALRYDAHTVQQIRSELGVATDASVQLANGDRVQINTRLAWAHAFVDDNSFSAAFSAFPAAGFTTHGAKPEADALLASASAALPLSRNAVLTLRGQGKVASNAWSYAGALGVRATW